MTRTPARVYGIDAGKCSLPTDIAATHAALVRAESALKAAGGAAACHAGYELARVRGDLATSEGDLATAARRYDEAIGDRLLPNAVRTDIQWALARTIVEHDRTRARRLAGQAREGYVKQGPASEDYVVAIDEWLTEHP